MMNLLNVVTLASLATALAATAYLRAKYRKDEKHRRWGRFIAAKGHPRATRRAIVVFWLSNIAFLACGAIESCLDAQR